MQRTSLSAIDEDHKISVSWISKNDQIFPIAYSHQGAELVPHLNLYGLHLAVRGNLDRKTVRNEIYLLKSFFEQILTTGVCVDDINDEWLTQFRDSEVERVMCSNNSRAHKKTAQRTVNAKLRCVYAFLIWYQHSKPTTLRLIGNNNCQVYVPCAKESLSLFVSPGNKVKASAISKAPLLFRRVSENGKSPHGRAATESDLKNLRSYFKNNHTPFVAIRNILIMTIGDLTGLRRGSINSLRCAQFSLEKIAKCKEKFPLRPDSQKFGYENFFEIPIDLALQIAEFIAGPRNNFLKEMGWSEAHTHDRIFVSARDGKPLNDNSLSQIFGDASRAIGLGPGHAIHMLRFKNVDDRIAGEIESRVALGLDTSTQSIAASVSMEVGHSNPESLWSYVSQSQSKIAQRKKALKIDPGGSTKS